MEKINQIKSLEKISSNFPNRILRLRGYAFKNNKKEFLEIIIFKGFSSSTTHEIELDSEKQVINFEYILNNCQLLKAPLTEDLSNLIKENEDINLFIEEENWI